MHFSQTSVNRVTFLNVVIEKFDVSVTYGSHQLDKESIVLKQHRNGNRSV